MLRGLFYIYKIKAYEKLIIKMTKLRVALRVKQAAYTIKQEEYRAKLDKHNEC